MIDALLCVLLGGVVGFILGGLYVYWGVRK